MTFNWNNIFKAIELYLTFRKGQDNPSDIVKPIPPDKPVPKPTPKPSPTPAPQPTPAPEGTNTTWQKMIDHYNPESFDSMGVSITFCAGAKYKSVTINGMKMRLHAENDEGRELWTTVDWKGKKPTNVRGLVVAVGKDGKEYRFNLDLPAHKRHWSDWKGDCFRKGLH